MDEKKEFVSKIGKENQLRKSKRKSSIKLEKGASEVDEIKEIDEYIDDEKIKKKYSRSAKKITALKE